tara:strand:- start:26718 stop:27128 length:411 start_codon:yes stop_codon:yes gene_type:complete
MNYYSICYVSNVANGLSQQEIDAVLNLTEQKNNQENVTGILLHNLGHFFQVLEGEEELIKKLFHTKISVDPRHSEITTIFDKHIVEPLFSGYDSKFNILKTPEDLQRIKAYLIKKTGKTSDKVLRVLKPFLLYEVH